MAEDYLTQGITAVKAGNKEEARRLLDAAIRAAPNDERTWGWFFNVCENDAERLHCVKEILRINPNNEMAKQKYNELIGLGFQPPPAVPQKATVTKGNNPKRSQPPYNTKQGLSREWVIFGIVGGLGVLTIAGIGIAFLFQNAMSPAKEISNTPLPSSTPLVPQPTHPANQLPYVPAFDIPTMPPYPTFALLPTDTSPPPITAAPPFTPQTQKLGPIHDTERDTYFSLEITVTDVKWLISDNYSTPKTGNVFLIVYLKAKNLGPDSAQSVGSLDFQILDSNGLVHDHDFLSSAQPCQLDYVDMLPNGTFEGCDAYEVPRNGKLEFIYAPYKNDPLSPGRYLAIVVRP